MLAPTPVLKPSPIDIGGLFSGSFEALKRRFGLLVLIALMPSLVVLAVIVAGTMLMLPSIIALANGDRTAAPAGLVAGIAVLVLGMVFAALVQLKSYGMLSLAAYEIAQGQRPDFRGLLSRSRGFLPRMAAVIAIGFGVVIVFYLLLFLVMGAAIGAAASGGRTESGAVVALFGMLTLVMIAAVPIGLFLTTKLLYTVPAVALEQLGGIDALKRSWNLTRGAFWRTLGYFLLGYLAVAAVSYAVGLVGQVILVPLGLGTSSISQSSDPAQALAVLGALIPAMLLVYALQIVVQVVAYPFLQAYTTYMFIDQVRRSEMPPAPPYGYPGGGYYTQPGQYYGQQPYPPQTYPTPGQAYPGQAPQAPGGWTPPGQAQPPQQWGGQQYPPQQGWGGQPPPSGQGPTQG